MRRIKFLTAFLNAPTVFTKSIILTITVYGIMGYVFFVPVGESGIIIESSIGNYSSFAESKLSIPITIKSCEFLHSSIDISEKVVRPNTITYGVNLSLESGFLIYPCLGIHFARRQVNEEYSERAGYVSSTGRKSCYVLMKISSMETLTWTDLGLEFGFPKKQKNGNPKHPSFIFRVGGSLIHAEDKTKPGSSYVYHYENWGFDIHPEKPPELLDVQDEEKDLGGIRSSGLGLGWYCLAGIRFYISRSFSLTLNTRIDFGNVKLKIANSDVNGDLDFYSSMVSVNCSYKFW